MMYWLYHKHHVLPSSYYRMGDGERIIVRAFFEREIEDMNIQYEEIDNT